MRLYTNTWLSTTGNQSYPLWDWVVRAESLRRYFLIPMYQLAPLATANLALSLYCHRRHGHAQLHRKAKEYLASLLEIFSSSLLQLFELLSVWNFYKLVSMKTTYRKKLVCTFATTEKLKDYRWPYSQNHESDYPQAYKPQRALAPDGIHSNESSWTNY